MNSISKITLGFVTGTLLGTSIGLLFAPDKGVRTRERISEKGKEVSNSIEKGLKMAKKQLA